MRAGDRSFTFSVGIAIFSMFFGSGNVVFPILLGEQTGNLVGMALLGVVLTAVGAPLIGLLGCMLYEGDCKAFFYRIGKLPGILLIVILLALLGPIGVMPRCFIVSYGAIQSYFPNLSLFYFSIISGIITLLLIAKREWVLAVLGKILSPVLIILLTVIVILGLKNNPPLPAADYTALSSFQEGLVSGYYMMDLLAALFFGVSIWMLIKEKWQEEGESYQNPKLMKTYLKASLIGGAFLALAYIGLSVCAAGATNNYDPLHPELALPNLAVHILGSQLAVVANAAIALACLTTVMSLAVAIGDVIHVELNDSHLGKKLYYRYDMMMVILIVITVAFSNWGFTGIMELLGPIVIVLYPAVVVLTLCNIFHRLFSFKMVKLPFYATLFITLVLQSSSVWATPQLMDFQISGSQVSPIIAPNEIQLDNEKEYVFVIENTQENAVFLHYGAFGQSVSTQYLHGNSNLSSDGLILLPEMKLTWHFYTKRPGEFLWAVSDPGAKKLQNPGKITIQSALAQQR